MRGPGRNGGPMMHRPRGSVARASPLIELKLWTGAPPWTTVAGPDLMVTHKSRAIGAVKAARGWSLSEP